MRWLVMLVLGCGDALSVDAPLGVSRREALRGCGLGAAAVVCAPLGALASQAGLARPGNGTLSSPQANVSEALSKNKMVVKQKVGPLTEMVVDPSTADEYRELRLPAGWPRRLRPPRVLARRVGDAELVLCSAIAGGLTHQLGR